MNQKFYNLLLNQEPRDLEQIINFIKYGKRVWFQKNKTIGLFQVDKNTDDTVFILLAKKDNLSVILTAVFDDVLSIVEREAGQSVDVGNAKLASSLVLDFCLKNNKQGNNALFYSIQRRKYDVLDKIVKFYLIKTNYDTLDKIKGYPFLDEFQEYLVKTKTVDLVKIVSTSITKGYTDLSNFFFEFLQYREQHKIPELIKSIKQQKIKLDEGEMKRLTRLCYHSYNYILDSIDIEEEVKQKIVTLMDRPLKYDNQFKNQFPNFNVSLKEYILDDLCEQYLNNPGDFQVGNISSLIFMLDEYNYSNFTEVNISHTQTETCIFMDSPNKNTTENNASSSSDFFNGFISGILSSAATVVIVYLGCRFMKTHYYESDSTTGSTGNLTIESQISRTLDASNCEEFFKDELSRVKALAHSGKNAKSKFYKRDLGKKIEEFVNSEACTEALKAKLIQMLNKSYKDITEHTKNYGYHQSYIDKIAEHMGIQRNKDNSSVFSIANTTQASASAQTSGVVSELHDELLGAIIPEDTPHIE